MKNVHLTFDIDWASDEEINEVLALIIGYKIKCTLFMTHETKLIDKIRKYSQYIEVGIHPNFGVGSTQMPWAKRKFLKLFNYQPSIYSVIDYLLNLFPEAKSFRTHAMYYSHYINQILTEKYKMKIDSSICLYNMKNISSFKMRYKKGIITNLFYYWSDDSELSESYPEFDLTKKNNWLEREGLKILCFHPKYIFNNDNVLNLFHQIIERGKKDNLALKDDKNNIIDPLNFKKLIITI